MTSPTIGFVSLGCPKALVDSEIIITKLRAEGYTISPDYDGADLVVINTCGFIDSAVDESLDAIQEAMDENGKVIVTGCLGAKGNIVRDQFPDVLAITGPHASEEVVAAIHTHLPPLHDPHQSLIPVQGIKLTPKHYAYLKISEGCNHRCSFCIIPSLRGDLVSRPIDEVLTDAENLVSAGVKELLVISQDTSAYGVDLKYKRFFWHQQSYQTRFVDLAKALGQLGVWVRMHYVYPYPHVDNVIPLMAEGLILPYLDIPFQHASHSILKTMKRPAHAENTLQRIAHWRSICPEIKIRSTFIVGFPGETQSDFEELLQFLDTAQLDRVGCFPYSAVDGAKANELPNPVDEDVKQERLATLMSLQEDISTKKLKQHVGTSMRILVDSLETDCALGRSYADAPEIDGLVEIRGNIEKVSVGDFVVVDIVDSSEHDLIAEISADKSLN